MGSGVANTACQFNTSEVIGQDGLSKIRIAASSEDCAVRAVAALRSTAAGTCICS